MDRFLKGFQFMPWLEIIGAITSFIMVIAILLVGVGVIWALSYALLCFGSYWIELIRKKLRNARNPQ